MATEKDKTIDMFGRLQAAFLNPLMKRTMELMVEKGLIDSKQLKEWDKIKLTLK